MAELNQNEWDQKAIGLNGSILQSWIWGEFQEAMGCKIRRVFTDDYLGLFVETPLGSGKSYLYAPKGPLSRTEAGIKAAIQAVGARDFVFARIEPEFKVDLPKAIKNIQPPLSWVLGLKQSEDLILAKMKPKHRYNLNLATKKGVTVREGNREDLLKFLQLLKDTSVRNHFRLHPDVYYLKLYETLSPNFVRLFLAEYQGQIVAGLFLTLFNKTAIYLHGGSSDRFKETMATYTLQWHAIKFAKAQGMEVYDFGGIAPANQPDHSWAGISRFKRGFGGREAASPGAYDFVVSRFWYNVYAYARKLRSIVKK